MLLSTFSSFTLRSVIHNYSFCGHIFAEDENVERRLYILLVTAVIYGDLFGANNP